MTGVPANPPILQVENLTKFFGGLAAIREVSFEVAEGQIYGIIGPNGAGKTTLFSMIGGAFRPSSGKVRTRGQDITALRPFQRVQVGIARTHQIVRPFRAMSVLENVQVAAHFGRQKSNAREYAVKVLRSVGLEKLANDPAYVLSVGNQKKLEVARALATSPDLLLCDEICGGLTHAETASMLQLLREIRDRGTTVMYVEHDVKAITAICDRIMVLNYGRKLAEGTAAEIQLDAAVIEAYLGVPPEERFNA